MPTFIKHYINQTIKIGSDGWWELLDNSGNIIIRAYGDGTLVIPSLGVGGGGSGSGVGDNVKSYGAHGDGVTDDTAAIQNAITNGSTHIVYFPAGVYKVSSTLNFVGGRTYIFAAGAKIKYTGNSYAISISSQKQIVWLGGEIDLTLAGSTAIGLLINGLWESSFVNLQITLADSGEQYGIWIRPGDDWGSYSLDFINPRIRGGGEALFRVSKEMGESTSVTHLNIHGGWVSGSASYAFHLMNLLDSRIENTVVGAVNTAIYVDKCSHLVLSPGEVEGNPARGIYFGSSDNHDIWIVLASRTSGLIVDETNYKPNYLDSAKGIRLFPSTSDQNYYVHLEPRYDYNNSFNLKVKGGGSERNLLSFGDVSGLKIFDGLMNLTPAGKVGVGTNTPGEKLSVEGNVLARGGDGTGFRILSDSTNTLYGIGLWGNRLEFFRNEGGNWNWAMLTSEGGKWKFGGYVDKWDALLQVDGDVLIKGDLSNIARNYLFEVKGPIKVTGIRNTLLRNDLVSKTGLLIPFYRYPWAGGTWDSIFESFLDTLQKYHEVPVFVAINPSNGPGNIEDGVWRRAIKKLHGAGAVVLGYIFSSYATRDINQVKADIDTWRSLYPEVDGLFVDEMTNDDDQEHRNYYIEVTRYAHKKGFYPVVGNPGAGVPGNYFTQDTADIIVIWETGYYPDEITLKGGDWEDSYREIPVWRRAALVHSQSSLSYSDLEIMRKYVGLLYVTSGNMPNPWGILPNYFEDILSYLAHNSTSLTGATYDLLVGTRTANNLKFMTNNTERVVIDPQGNVGIGTATPDQKLVISGTGTIKFYANAIGDIQFSANARPHFASGDFNIYEGQVGFGTLRFGINAGGDTFLVPNGGRVGFGTTLPETKFEFSGGHLQVSLGGVGAAGGGIRLKHGDKTGIGRYWDIFNMMTTPGDGLLFAVGDGTTTNSAMFISDDGRVGIGTTSPLNKLDVRGFIRVAGPLADSYSASALRLSATDSDSSWYIAYRGSLSGEEGNLSCLYSNRNNWVSLLSLTPSGNVGIGTTTPSEKLVVAGNIVATGTVYAQSFSGGTLTGNINASQVSSGIFGSIVGKGNYTFQASGNTNPILHIDATNERVGIGTTAPQAKLHVVGSGAFNANVINVDNTADSWYSIQLKRGGDPARDYFIGRAPSTFFNGRALVLHVPTAAAEYGGVGAQPQIAFVSTGADLLGSVEASTGNWYMKGNVGIGTTAPNEKLHIYGGKIKIEGISGTNILITSAISEIQLKETLPSFFGRFQRSLDWIWGSSYYTYIGNGAQHVYGSDEYTYYIDNPNHNPVVFTLNSDGWKFISGPEGSTGNRTLTEVARLTWDGKLGIGTTAPNEKLHIYGGKIKIEGISGTNILITSAISEIQLKETLPSFFGRFQRSLDWIWGSSYYTYIGNGAQHVYGSDEYTYYIDNPNHNPVVFTLNSDGWKFISGPEGSTGNRTLTEVARLTWDGKFALGTQTPNYKMTVRGDGFQLAHPDDGTQSNRGFVFVPSLTTGSNPHELNAWGNNSGLLIKARNTSTGNSSAKILVHPQGYIVFYTGVYPNEASEVIRIINNGNAGFGTQTPTAKVHINGATGYNQLRLATSYTPTSSTDPNGNVGDFAWDDNYLYIKTSVGWKRAALSAF
jgi:hypothetical protein